MKLNKWTIALAATGVVSIASAVQADESHPVNTLLSSTTLSGYVDTAAIWNFGSDSGSKYGNQSVAKRFANTAGDRQDGFNLNAVKIQLEKPLDEGTWSAGYKVETLLGPDANWLPGALGGSGTGGVALKQAYVALRAPVGNGLDFKIGQFDPIIGYEVTDSYANPNFSRSLAFANLEPYGHQGVLATYQFSDVIGASVGVSNNSNTARYASGAGGTLGGINGKYGRESAKSYMAGIVLKAPDSTGWLAGSSLYAGIVKGWESGKNNDPVNYYVGGSLSTPWKELSVGAAYDYLANGKVVNGLGARSYGNAISLYASYQATEKLKLNARGEYATSDYGAFLPNTSGKDKILGLTLTADYSLWANVVTRAELRWDHAAGGSNLHPFGADVEGERGHKNDVSLAINVIYKF